jgi:hypothetical protein
MAMKKFTGLFILFLSGFYFSLTAQTDTISQRIVLVGDAGSLTNGKHPVVDAIKQVVKLDKKTTVLFLGDNLYDSGLPDDQSAQYQAAKAVLDSQLSVVEGTQARVIMIPGNHDWNNGARDGYETIIREQIYVDLLNKPNVQFYPKDGCPGPVEVDLGNDVTLVIFDSQWWIHPYDKPGVESDCDYKTPQEVLTQLTDIVTRKSKNLVLLACHHPFKSNSVHGGFFPIKQHIFPFTDIKKSLYIPLPIIGSIYPVVRSVFGTPQDLTHPNYVNMINDVKDAVKTHPHLVFVAGHDHGLQMIRDSNYNYIVSGGGCKLNRVSKGKNSLYAEEVRGFAVMEVSTNKNVTVSFYTVTDSVRNKFGTTLFNFSSVPEPTGDSSKRVVDVPNVKYKDTFTISASDKYQPVSGFKKFILGQNYRADWSTPVNMKVFNINKEKGGMKVTGLGGGEQTKTLHLKDIKTGKKWILRSVDKLPTGALPIEFRVTVSENLIRQLNSASYPYAPLTIPDLAKPLNIAVPHPELFFVPDDPALGFYQPYFANTVCMLEEIDPSFDGSDTKSTAKVFNQLIAENDNRADQFAVLRARLLDILIGDFDRHFDQWKWATSDTGQGKLWYPIPRDRDEAYFYSDGELIKASSRKLLPFLVGFRKDIPKVNWLGYSARDFDRLFLTDLDKSEWEKTISEVQQKITDSVIASATKKLPAEIFPLSGKALADKLISRRNALPKAALTYYKFISRAVNVVGSNKNEYFKVSNRGDGLEVKVYGRENGTDTNFVMYDRIFEPAITKEIRLYGLGGDDIFDVDDNAKSRIKLRIIGGRGRDTFDIRGKMETLIYDINTEVVSEKNYVKKPSHAKNRFSKDPPVNSYSILGFRYNQTEFPRIQLGGNSDDGFVVGAGFSKRTYGFRNDPYATDQKFSAFYQPKYGTYRVKYDAEFNHLTHNIDLVLKTDIGYPRMMNFFGLGNNTEIDKNNYGFYKTRFRSIELQTLLRQRVFDKMQLLFGPYFFYYENKYSDNIGRILGQPHSPDSTHIYTKKTYLGAKLAMKYDNRNNEVFPTRGIIWNNEFLIAGGMSGDSKMFSKIGSDMTIYASLSDPARLIGVVSFGGEKILSKSFEFFQAVNIGGYNTHGFRANRYLGQSSLYASTELRYKLFDNAKSYLFPGPIGVTGFYDIGRVWLDEEHSKRWHTAYGGGFYFIPYNRFMVAATVGYSAGEKLFSFTLGTKINLSY